MEDLLSIEEYFKTMPSYTKRLALAHYDRMIAWAKKQDLKESPNMDIMYLKLGETWGGKYCNYCEKYIKCLKCPLGKYGSCCDFLYSEMNISITWKEWVINAKKVRKYIKDNG